KLDAVAAGKARRSLDIADYPNPDLGIEVDMSPQRLIGRESMPLSESPRSGVSMESARSSSSSGWRTTAPTEPWTEAHSYRCMPRRSVAGSSKKIPTTNAPGRVVSSHGPVPSWLRGRPIAAVERGHGSAGTNGRDGVVAQGRAVFFALS